jgi:hypothetical protein
VSAKLVDAAMKPVQRQISVLPSTTSLVKTSMLHAGIVAMSQRLHPSQYLNIQSTNELNVAQSITRIVSAKAQAAVMLSDPQQIIAKTFIRHTQET